jgi:hypothetical protein
MAAGEDERQEQAAALARRADAQRNANEALALRIREQGAAAIQTLLELVRDVATAATVDAELNGKLHDAEKIKSADVLARYRVPAPRKNISEKTVSLWTFASTGYVVGDQDGVVPTGDGDTGFLRGSPQHKTQVVRRKFRSISYQEAETHQQLVPFFAALRLPSPDGPGLVWDPREGLSAAAAVEVLKHRPAEVAERETLTELVPIEFVPRPEFHGWGRAGDI